MAATQVVEGLAAEGPVLTVVAKEPIKPYDSSSESSIIPFDGALDSGLSRARVAIIAVLTTASSFSFLMTMVCPQKSVGAEDRVEVGAVGDAEIGNDDTKGGEGGEALANCPGVPLSSRRGIL